MPLWASSYLCEYLEVCMLSHVQLFVTLIDCSPPCSSVHGILQAGILEWVAISSSRGSSWPRDRTNVSCISYIGRQIIYPRDTWGAHVHYTNILCTSQNIHMKFQRMAWETDIEPPSIFSLCPSESPYSELCEHLSGEPCFLFPGLCASFPLVTCLPWIRRLCFSCTRKY